MEMNIILEDILKQLTRIADYYENKEKREVNENIANSRFNNRRNAFNRSNNKGGKTIKD